VLGKSILLNGVNCQRVMGSGVAKAYFTKWPKVRKQYMSFTKDQMVLGMIDPVWVEEDICVMNMWTQEYYGRDNKVYASLIHIEEAINKTFNYAISRGIYNIYSPRIGCGLGGLPWQHVETMLSKQERLYYPNINLIICDI